MVDEKVYVLMNCFPSSYLNRLGEMILEQKENVYFVIKDCKTEKDIATKMLEWCSRPMAKGRPYSSENKNNQYRNKLIDGLNKYLKTSFDQRDMYCIYERLGNGINKELTKKFIESGYDMNLISEKEEEDTQ